MDGLVSRHQQVNLELVGAEVFYPGHGCGSVDHRCR
jgi:hypothetical protein